MLALGSELPNFQGVTHRGSILDLDDYLNLIDATTEETSAATNKEPKFSWMLLVTTDKALAPVFSTVCANIYIKLMLPCLE